ncbi:DNA internalization-related competence protein ComEC/Rec2 [Stenotrophomonas sp. C3(2023)]|uniref:DNA internalization-related competence protein ComEC/Rec2 n=1 Tax=Stenotrophomonas sp. C3(2023) TaxID=3080277 RepID=UPI00293CA9B3|nr:DNA internalization-related competence protein ComEC/Rec2 [Stenotrophomonas sp. C3(2023)]MDV3469146.1 DNA internalization-related competence protein ComEC/Rec2 [Stenotrophomonas sp. C3(2023)]
MQPAQHRTPAPGHAAAQPWPPVPVPPIPARLGRGSALALTAGATACAQAPALLPAPAAWAGVLLGAVLWWPNWRGRWLGMLLIGVCWASLHGHWSLQAQLAAGAPPWDGVLAGRIVDLPEHRAAFTRFLLQVDDAPGVPAALCNKRVQVYWSEVAGHGHLDRAPPGGTSRRGQVRAGARWQLALRLRPPRGTSNPGGFDAERHALLLGIAATATVREPALAREMDAPRGVAAWREAMAARITRALPGERARFIRALALGDTRALGDQDWYALRALGLTHLIAISGFHVGMVGVAVGALMSLLWRCHRVLPQLVPRPIAAALGGALGAAGYALVAGLSLPTVRTALMIVVVATACAGRRRPGWGQALALAALASLMVAPLSVLSAGFWLSFGGVLCLLWCLPGGVGSNGLIGMLHGFVRAQVVASLALLPLVIALFGQASRLGPLVNLLAVPCWSLLVVPPALLGTALEAVHPGLGGWAWQLAAAVFDASWRWLQPLSGSEAAIWWLPEAPRWAVPLSLLGIFWFLLPRPHGGLLAAALLSAPLLWPAARRPAQGAVEVLVFDVGQGTAVLVRTAHHSLLYDTGPPGSTERAVLPALHALGEGPPNRVMLSHTDTDHAGGLAALRLAMPGLAVQAPAGARIPDAGVCQRGQHWRWDAVVFEVLHPPPSAAGHGNEASCVLRIVSPHGTVLLPGDVGQRAEAALLQADAGALAAQVVLVPHHGSGGSSSAAWVAAVSPRLALVSAGHRNRFGHPRAPVVQRWRDAGAEVLGTAGSGALRVWLDGQGLYVREQRVHAAHWWDAAERSRAAAILSADKQAAAGPEG